MICQGARTKLRPEWTLAASIPLDVVHIWAVSCALARRNKNCMHVLTQDYYNLLRMLSLFMAAAA